MLHVFFQKWISTKIFLSQLETPRSELLRLNCLQKSCNLTGGQYEWIPRKPNCTIAESNKKSCERKVCQRSLSLQWAMAKQAIHAATQLIWEESLARKASDQCSRPLPVQNSNFNWGWVCKNRPSKNTDTAKINSLLFGRKSNSFYFCHAWPF